jgi:hypothetical protein
MTFAINIRHSHLRVGSEVCSNLVVVFLVSIFGTRDVFVLTRSIILVILFAYLAVKAHDKADQI